MKTKSNKTIFFILLFVFFIVGIGVYATKNDNLSSDSNTSNSNTANEINSQGNENTFKGSLVYLTKSTDGNDIYKTEINSSPKKIYTDKDEENKIKSAQSITTSGKVLAVLAPENQEFGGSLYLIDTNDVGKSDKIVDNFASTEAPVISPNGKKIAYVNFSNVEIDYGFTLYIMNTDGSSKQKISSDPVGIKILSWKSDSNKICYVKGDASKESSLFSADLNGNSDIKLTSFKEKIYSLNWLGDKMILSKGSTGNDINKTEIYKMDESGKNIERLTNDDKHDDFCYFSPDGNAITYLSVDYNKNVDTNVTGDINALNLKDSAIKKVTSGNYIIGWIKN